MAELITSDAAMSCPHGGQAQPLSYNIRVKANGQPILVQTSSCAISGCSLSPELNGPCLNAQWLTGTVRVKASSLPIIYTNSQALINPTAAKLTVMPSQLKVKAQ